MLKRDNVVVCHKQSERHVDRYWKEYGYRFRLRELDKIVEMNELITQYWGVN